MSKGCGPSRALAAAFACLLVAASQNAWAQSEFTSRIIYLDAVIASGAAPIREVVNLSIRPLGDVGDRDTGAILIEAVPARLSLEPGWYRADIRYREVNSRLRFQVTDDADQRRTLDLQAGHVQLGVIEHPGGRMIERPIRWSVMSYGRTPDGRRAAIAEATSARPRFLLSKGYYVAEAVLDGRSLRHIIEVSAGRNYNYVLTLNARSRK